MVDVSTSSQSSDMLALCVILHVFLFSPYKFKVAFYHPDKLNIVFNAVFLLFFLVAFSA